MKLSEPRPRALPPPAGPCPLAHPPLLFLLSAASFVKLLTLIPNRCCHFCLAAASDYSTGEGNKNPLSPFSLAQHMEQTANEMWYERFQKHQFFFAAATLCPYPLVCCVHWLISTASVERQRWHINSTGVELLSVLLGFFFVQSPDISHLLCLIWKKPFSFSL